MFVKFMRENVIASTLLLVFRLYLGYTWITSGWGKITGDFDATGFLRGAVANATGEHPAVQGWWATFLESFAIPNAGLFSFLVQWGEFLIGIALILGLFTTFAALMASVLNFAFLFSGTTSTNPQMVILTMFILVAGYNAGRFGLDHYVLPYIKKNVARNNNDKTVMTKHA